VDDGSRSVDVEDRPVDAPRTVVGNHVARNVDVVPVLDRAVLKLSRSNGVDMVANKVEPLSGAARQVYDSSFGCGPQMEPVVSNDQSENISRLLDQLVVSRSVHVERIAGNLQMQAIKELNAFNRGVVPPDVADDPVD